jgi:enoyl-CoA hydratase/carnithine racemase
MTEELEISIENHVATLTFNRPAVRNALTPALLERLIAAIGQLEADDAVRVLVLTGTGESFSSGGDRDFLRQLTAMTPEQIGRTVYRAFAGAAKAIKLCAKPTVAAVNGAAVGAGCELAVACDFRLVTPQSVFLENWIELGIVPPLGGMFLLPRLIGLERAANMIMRGQRVGGAEAVAIGLASELVAADQLAAAARAFAEDLARRSPRALAVAKAGLRRGMEGTLGGEWEFNIQAQSLLIGGPDFREAVAAMEQKREPVF